MRKFSNFCGIFAIVFVTTTVVLLASCSQDDDNYDSDMYTMAEMGTRLGNAPEPIPGGGGQHKVLNAGSKNDSTCIGTNACGLYVCYKVSWDDQFETVGSAHISIEGTNNHSIISYRNSDGKWDSMNKYEYLSDHPDNDVPTLTHYYINGSFYSYCNTVYYTQANIDPVTHLFLGKDTLYHTFIIITDVSSSIPNN